MKLSHVVERLRQGSYCLWVGAGLDIHIASAGSGAVPTWPNLVKSLEREASLRPPKSATYAQRLDVCLRSLGRDDFQRSLRLNVLNPFAEAIVAAFRAHGTEVPGQIRQVAHLGTLANPIVNFNIETLSSRLLAAPDGPYATKVFRPSITDAVSPPRGAGRMPHSRFSRHVLHPHGAIEESGICVMTESEYRAMRGTLSLELAAHSAFDCDLAIVGMSMEDEYLREQIDRFRHQMGTIYWFIDGKVPRRLEPWIYANDIEVVMAPWPDFWEAVAQQLPAPDEWSLRTAWLTTTRLADDALRNPRMRVINHLLFWGAELEEKTNRIRAAAMSGELVHIDPRDINTPLDPEFEERVRAFDERSDSLIEGESDLRA